MEEIYFAHLPIINLFIDKFFFVHLQHVFYYALHLRIKKEDYTSI